jgi:DNA-directed RNA polymerase specialized sigma24 family protein
MAVATPVAMTNAPMVSPAATARARSAQSLDAFAEIARAARGAPEEKRRRLRALSPELVRALGPVVRSSVEKAMRRRRGGRHDIAHDVDDFVQAVHLALFVQHGSALEAWDPDHRRALGLKSFVALIAAREVDSILRSRRRNPWTEEPAVDAGLDACSDPEAGAETVLGSRRMISTLVARLRARVSPLGFTLFEMLLLQERTPDDVATALGLKLSAVYTWRSRLCGTARQIVGELERDA